MIIVGQQESYSNDMNESDDYIEHYGTPHVGSVPHSGRYPWGSGDSRFKDSSSFLNRYHELRKSGMSDAQAASALGMTTNQIRAYRSIATNQERAALASRAYALKEKGWGATAIARELSESMGREYNESTVRSLLDPSRKDRMDAASKISESLKATIPKNGAVEIGKGTELFLGISSDKLKVATTMLEAEGYTVQNIYVDQLGMKGKKVTSKVLMAPGAKLDDIYNDPSKLAYIAKANPIEETGSMGMKPPVPVESSRVKIRYKEDKGIQKDGVMEINPQAVDLRLSPKGVDKKYAQVRISVDGTHYLKGMAVYGDPKDFPKGVDIIFNTNKSNTVSKMDVLKKMKDDPDSPFGATVRQYDYLDPKTGKYKQSPINLVNDEGTWSEWSRNLPSQVLSKQTEALAKRQLSWAYDRYKMEYDEINSLTNPVVKRKLMREFSDSCDSAAVHMKGAAMPRQATKVILPITSLKDNEIYAPHLRNGENVVLVRFPHGGRFEIPELVVNNTNREGKRVMGNNPKDAVGINSHVAGLLSGADFDGDTVLVIPNNRKEFKTRTPLAGLKDFDPSARYPKYEGMKVITNRKKQIEMGKVSNLITDMTLKGADWSEIERAVRHSMVVIDSEKHELNYKQSEKDNGIRALKAKWQGGSNSGASTLISRATSDVRVNERKLRPAKDGGPIDPKTGKYMWVETGNKYPVTKSHTIRPEDIKNGKVTDPISGLKVPVFTETTTTPSGKKKIGYYFEALDYKGRPKFDESGKRVLSRKSTTFDEKGQPIIEMKPRLSKVQKMSIVDDARVLSSGTGMEEIYANHANRLKALGNQARKTYIATEVFRVDPQARKEYAGEVASLNAKLNRALKNMPLERRAQVLANQQVKARQYDNPNMDDDQLDRVRRQALHGARLKVGADKKSVTIHITDGEWNAIQNRAISSSKLEEILRFAPDDEVKQLATPRHKQTVAPYILSKAKTLLNKGYTFAEVADAVGISVSTLEKSL